MNVRVRALQRCIQERGFHPLTEFEEQELTRTLHRELAELDGLGGVLLNSKYPAFGIDKIINSMVDTFYMLRNVSREWR